jgi:hypothetical protein
LLDPSSEELPGDPGEVTPVSDPFKGLSSSNLTVPGVSGLGLTPPSIGLSSAPWLGLVVANGLDESTFSSGVSRVRGLESLESGSSNGAPEASFFFFCLFFFRLFLPCVSCISSLRVTGLFVDTPSMDTDDSSSSDADESPAIDPQNLRFAWSSSMGETLGSFDWVQNTHSSRGQV